MPDPKYGASSAGFAEALGRTLAAAEALEKSLARLTATEAASTRTVGANATARDALTAAMTRQAEAAGAVSAALSAETRAMEANSAAWRTNAAARAATGVEAAGGGVGGAAGARGSRFGGSGASIGALDVTAAEARGTASAAAQVAAEERFFSRQYERPGVGGPGRYKYNLPTIGESPPLRALPEDPATRRLLEGAQTRQPLLLGAGPPVPRTVPTVNYGASLKEYTEEEQKAIAAGQGLVAGQGKVEQALSRTNAAYRVSVAEVAASSQALQRHGALTAEFVQALSRGEVTLAEFGSQLTTTIGKFAGWAVAGGLVYGAYEALKTLGRGAADTASGIAQLERTGVPINRQQAASGFRQLSGETNVPISQAAEAQFYAIRSGFHDQAESLDVAKTILLAYKLDLVSVSDAARSFGAIHRTMGLDAKGVAGVFNELDQGQRQYNARLQQTLPQVGRAAASWAEAGGSAKGLVAAIVAINSATGGGGGTGGGNPATAILRLPANLERPLDQYALRSLGINPVNPRTGAAENVEQLLLGRGGNSIRGAIESGKYDNAEVRKLAEALGQAAVGLRYFAPLLSTFERRNGQPSEFTEIEKGLHQPGSAAEDLEKKLSQFDEVLGKVPRTLERIGSEIGNIGLTQALEAAAIGFVVVAEGVETVLTPLSALGQTLSALPGPLRDLLLIGGGAFAVSRVASSERLAGFRRPASEVPGLGFLDSPSQRALREARATVRTGVQFGTNEVEQAAARNRAAQVAAQDAAERAETFRANNAAQIVRLQREPGFATTPAGEKFIAETERVEQERVAAANKGRASSEALTRTKTRLLAEEKLQTDLDDRRIALRDKLARTGAIAPFGAPTTENLEGPNGPVGSSAEARGLSTPGGLIIPGGYRPGDLRGTQARATAEAAGTTSLADIYDLTLGATAGGLATAAENAAGKAKAIGERASVTAGKFTKGFGERAMQGLMVAFIGQLAAEVAGERLGLGSGVQSAISTGALGAGVGSLLPGRGGALIGGAAGLGLGIGQQSRGPGTLASILGGAFTGAGIGAGIGLAGGPLDFISVPAGAAAGAIIGGGINAATNLLGGGGKPEALGPLLKREQEARLAYIKGETQRAEEIEPVAKDYAAAITNAFKGSGESVQKAMSEIGKAIGNASAEIKIFGAASKQGQAAAKRLEAQAAALLAGAAKNPAYAEEAASKYEAALNARNAAALDRYKTARLTSPRGLARNEASVAEQEIQRNFDSEYTNPLQYRERELATIQERRSALEARARKLPISKRAGLTDQYGKNLAEYQTNEGNAEQIAEAIKATLPAKLAKKVEALETVLKDLTDTEIKAVQIQTKLAEAIAGANPVAKARAQAEGERKEANILKRNAKTEPERQAAQEKAAEVHANAIELGHQDARTQAEERKVEREGQLAGIGGRFPVQRAGVQLKIAEETAAEYKRLGSSVYKPDEIKAAANAVLSARVGYEEAALDELKTITELHGQIAEASAFGSGIAQARAAIGAAGALAAIAKTPAEALQAQLAGIQAQNQLFQAEQAHIGDVGALRESRQAEPLAKERTGIRTAEEKLKRAKPDEQITLQADINNKKRAYHEGQVSEAEEVAQFEFNQHEISVTQLVEKWQQIIKTQHLTRQQRREVLEKIRGAQEQNNTDFAVGYIGQVPTLYDARTLTKARAAGQPLLGISYDTIHHTPNLHQNNTIQVNVTGAHPGQFASEMERVFGSLTRAQLRSAGLS